MGFGELVLRVTGGHPNRFTIRRSTVQPVSGEWRTALAVALLVLLLCVYFVTLALPQRAGRLLIAPMVGLLDPCLNGGSLTAYQQTDKAFVACHAEEGSAAPVIETTLSALGPRVSRNGRYELGYTLNVPLLRLFKSGNGTHASWVVDDVLMDRYVRTIAQSSRSLVLYLFSNHFATGAPIESALASEPHNIAITPDGLLSRDQHYGMDVFPWTVANTQNSLTERRMQAIDALLARLCKQPSEVVRRIRGITVLGETHQLFPDFQSGMGFSGPYVVSDYSEKSIQGFRRHLRKKFHTVAELNSALGGGGYRDFEHVYPPSGDIRLNPALEPVRHLDAYAHGKFPVQGWLAAHPRLTGNVKVRVNGRPVGSTRAALGRQELLEQVPGLGSADVAWRFDLDFRDWKPGSYTISAHAEMHNGRAVLLGQRIVSVRSLGGAQVDAQAGLGQIHPVPADLPLAQLPGARGHLDMPLEGADFMYNPLVPLWHQFRGQQVREYIAFMARRIDKSCLHGVPRYTHQLFPYANPSWSYDKYAVDESLRETGDLRLGVSLYGEATYGASFFSWKTMRHRGGYGVTEFHPLKGMDVGDFRRMIDRHFNSGAEFLSFFTEARGDLPSGIVNSGKTIPYFSPGNSQYQSAQLYDSLQRMMLAP